MIDSTNVDKIKRELADLETTYKAQLRNAELREKDLTAKCTKLTNDLQDLNIEF